MIPILVLLVGAVLGFVGSRQLRRTTGSDALQQPRPPRPARPRPQAGAGSRPSPVAAPRPSASRPSAPRPTAPRSAPPATLALVRRDTGERTALTGEPLSIGRSIERNLTIADDRVSRTHAHLERRGSEWYVVDDGSANGTTLNRSKLTSGDARQIHAGDRIGIGPFDLDVIADGAVESSDRTQVYRS